MEAKELRIGNLVFIDNEKYHPKLKNIPLEVTAITPNLDESGWAYSISLKHINQKPNTYYETYSQFIKWVKPIPLIEERLLKFNEHKLKGKDVVIDRFKLIYMEAYKYWYVLDRLTLTYFTKVEFVHEWQNTYRFLNGTELTIKE